MSRALALLVLLTPAAASANWGKAKALAASVYDGHQVTFYCACPYKAKRVKRCDYKPASKWKNRARRIEWEHVVPITLMGCGTRAECERDRPDMVYDLHNLVPAIGQVNAYRGNNTYGYAVLTPWDGCEATDDGDVFSPPPRVRGDAARIWLYMHERHDVPISPGLRLLLHFWSEQDPVSAWERERNNRIKRIQGNGNPFVQ